MSAQNRGPVFGLHPEAKVLLAAHGEELPSFGRFESVVGPWYTEVCRLIGGYQAGEPQFRLSFWGFVDRTLGDAPREFPLCLAFQRSLGKLEGQAPDLGVRPDTPQGPSADDFDAIVWGWFHQRFWTVSRCRTLEHLATLGQPDWFLFDPYLPRAGEGPNGADVLLMGKGSLISLLRVGGGLGTASPYLKWSRLDFSRDQIRFLSADFREGLIHYSLSVAGWDPPIQLKGPADQHGDELRRALLS